MFLVPALFTVANIFFGFFSLVQSVRGEFGDAALAIGFAILADLVDGRVARFANVTSAFGKELDSLADMSSFGIAPAVLSWAWILHSWPRVGWLVAALFAVCAAVRLARFNVGRISTDPRYYLGLSSPAAAAVVGAVIYWHPEPPATELGAALSLFGVLVLALMMNSPVRYLSFKRFATRRPHSHRTLVIVAGFIVAALAEPVAVFLFLAGGYALHPLFRGMAGLVRRRRAGHSLAAPKTERVPDPGVPSSSR